MISQTVEYSLRAMALLCHDAPEPSTVVSLAERGQVPAPYLAKLLRGLVRAGLVLSQRGIGGGFSLARNPIDITLADIVNAVEPLQRIKKCPLGIANHETLCPLHKKMDEAMAMAEQAFRETTLADLLKGAPTPLCSATATPQLVELQ